MCKAERYRLRAEELRTIADTMKDKKSQHTLLRCAAEYDVFADLCDRIEKAPQK